MINLCLIQMEVETDIEKNVNKVIQAIKSVKSDIYIFPEMALTGYDVNIIPADNVIKKQIHILQEQLSYNQMLIIGSAFYEKDKIYNVALVIKKDSLQVYYKNTLTEYDKKVFASKENILIVEHNNIKIGIIICRDQSNLELIVKYKNKIDLLIQLSAHYYKYEEAIKKLDKNIAYPVVRAIDTNAIVCKVNCVGYLYNHISLGCSMIADSKGMVLRMAGKFEEEIIKIKIRSENDNWIYDGCF